MNNIAQNEPKTLASRCLILNMILKQPLPNKPAKSLRILKEFLKVPLRALPIVKISLKKS